MISKQFDLRQRTKAFSIAVMGLCRELPGTMEARFRTNGFVRRLRSGPTIVRSRDLGRGAEFVSKMGVVIEEADETLYWLEMVRDGHLLREERLHETVREAEQLLAIFVASQATARNKAKVEE